jgi:type II secretory pathway pseudopilin PulG
LRSSVRGTTPGPSGRSSARRDPAAFTLVEALVVVAVVALLMGMLLPALRMASGAARTHACQANLRQLSLAAFAYAASNREAMPPAVLHVLDAGVVRTVCWDFQPGPDGAPAPGVLWQYSSAPHAVQQCPDFAGSSTTPDDPATGYNYNTTYIGHEGAFPYEGPDGRTMHGWDSMRLGTPVAAFARPERTVVFGDGGWRSGSNKFMRAPGNSVEGSMAVVCAGTQAFRHAGGCTCCAHLDGHIGVVPQPARGASTPDALATWVMDFPRNGFLSEDDSAYGPR